ncbi:MAG: GNAT family N-acetyltransferase [Burkholderiaceae bacterium]|nr:GNAT family N-acetyltransferase [Burkholderiaceae bacterium]
MTELRYRKATLADAEAIRNIIVASVEGLSRGDYDERQIQAALGSAFGLDSELVRDGTYFVVEDGSEPVACGGWSKRKTLFGGDQQAGRQSELLDPAADSARVRAFFVRPEWARRGIGRTLLELCEAEARQHGFHSTQLMATLPGHRLYKACGYIGDERVDTPLPGEVVIEFIPMRKNLGG